MPACRPGRSLPGSPVSTGTPATAILGDYKSNCTCFVVVEGPQVYKDRNCGCTFKVITLMCRYKKEITHGHRHYLSVDC